MKCFASWSLAYLTVGVAIAQQPTEPAGSDPNKAVVDSLTAFDKVLDWNLFKTLNLKLKTFDTDESTGSRLGLEYSWSRAIASVPLGEPQDNPLAASMELHARGNVAFDPGVNPNDFLDSGVSFHVFQSIGGVSLREDVDRPALQQRMRDLVDEFVRKPAGEQPKFLRAIKSMEEIIARPQLLWDLSGHANIESNQDFSERQYVYGIQCGLALTSWRGEGTWLDGINFFDYPFALLRVLSGAEDRFRPTGLHFPRAIVGIDLVDPDGDEARAAVPGEGNPYPRFRGEVDLKTPIAKAGEDWIWIQASYRVYQEIQASPAIRAADLDTHSFVAVQLQLPKGFSLTYASGRLPLDQQNDDTFELGFNVRF